MHHFKIFLLSIFNKKKHESNIRGRSRSVHVPSGQLIFYLKRNKEKFDFIFFVLFKNWFHG